MDEGSGSEFQDWEVLHHEYDHTFPQVHNLNSRFFQLNEGDSGTIWLDYYFSLGNHEPRAMSAVEATECLVESEKLNPDDTESEHRNCGKTNMNEPPGSDASIMNEYELKQSQSQSQSHADIRKSVKGLEEISGDERGEEEDDGKWRGCPNVAMKSGDDRKESDESVNDIWSKDLGGVDGDRCEKIVEEEVKEVEVEAERRRWWKVLGLQVLRYWFLRATPAWPSSFSVAAAAAAAFMGMLILGRRLYKMMKSKTKSHHLKIAVDDKVWGFAADGGARLNAAFSMVAVVRGSLRGRGASSSSWPGISMW